MTSIKFQACPSCLNSTSSRVLTGHIRIVSLRQHHQGRFASVSTKCDTISSPEQFDQPRLTFTVGSTPVLQRVLTHRHIRLLSFCACAAAISTFWIFFYTIPKLLTLKRAASSLEKLMDAMNEELPETMAAVQLSGMEIIDLTTELSELGHEVTKGVKHSTRAAHLAAEKLQKLKDITPSTMAQGASKVQPDTEGLALARNVRHLREGIVKGHSILKMLVTLSQFFGSAFNFFTLQAKRPG